jgi:hypothetical protein
MMKAILSPDTSVLTKATRSDIPEHGILQLKIGYKLLNLLTAS